MSMENLGPYTNFHELNQDWFLNEFNKLVEQWKSMQKNFKSLQDAFNDLKNYIQDYFKNLDVQEEINNKLNSMALDGSLTTIIAPTVSSWLETHLTTTNPPVDKTLKVSNAAADSKIVGDSCINHVVNITPSEFSNLIKNINFPYMGNIAKRQGWVDLPDNVNQGILVNLLGTDKTYLQTLFTFDEFTNTIYCRVNTGDGTWQKQVDTAKDFSARYTPADSYLVGKQCINHPKDIQPTEYDGKCANIDFPFMGNLTRSHGWTDLPEGVNQGILVNLLGTGNVYLQELFTFDEFTNAIYCRVNTGDGTWQKQIDTAKDFSARSTPADSYLVGKQCINHPKDIQPTEYDGKCANIDFPFMGNLTRSHGWTDLPEGVNQGILVNLLGTGNVYLQLILTYGDLSNIYYRVNTSTKWLHYDIYNYRNGKRCCCIGDSITFGLGGTSWVTRIANSCGFTTADNYGVSGNLVNDIINRLDNIPSNYEYVTIWCGVNNFMWSSDTLEVFKAQFKSLIEKLIIKYPNSKLLCISPMKFAFTDTSVTPLVRRWDAINSNGNSLVDYVNTEREICEKYSVNYLDLFNEGGFTPDIDARAREIFKYTGGDLLHPNTNGNLNFLAPIISQKLNSL